MFTHSIFQFRFNHYIDVTGRNCTLVVVKDLTTSETIGSYYATKHPKDKQNRYVGKCKAFERAVNYLCDESAYYMNIAEKLDLWLAFHEARAKGKI